MPIDKTIADNAAKVAAKASRAPAHSGQVPSARDSRVRRLRAAVFAKIDFR